ncbi:MAG: peptidoglycan-associated lipoprotein Pal [Deltaproteobacteria bacterium]|nr:peptidoglycan-associated lipoprotein Pal [Deltaproteobacteria bacterium]MBW2296952.1 peptidoglycan-associated lipoprotein Pal [Deltaproteobacteria bacterium]
MRKKLWIYLALLVVIPGLMFTVSCAKKVTQAEPSAEETAAEAEPEVDTEARIAEEQAAQEEAARQWEMAAEEDIEEQRQAEDAAKEAEMQQDMAAAKQMFENEDIYFDFDSSALEMMATEVLKRKADWLFETADASIIIEGHCDERGTEAYNIALGDRRAESAKAFLVDIGVDESRLTSISYGEERPVDPVANAEAWAKNRRVHFVIE